MSKINPSAFISYSDDGITHKNWVINFANELRKKGIEATIDLFIFQSETTNMNKMMITGFTNSDFIIVVLTEGYVKKANDWSGGVGYEGEILIPILRDAKKKDKVILIKRSKASFKESLPTFLQDYYSIDFSEDSLFESKLTELLHRIFNIPLIKMEAIGPIPELIPLKEIPMPNAQIIDYTLDSNVRTGSLQIQFFDNKKVKFKIYVVDKNSLHIGRIEQDAITESPGHYVFKTRDSLFDLYMDDTSIKVETKNAWFYHGARVTFDGIYLINGIKPVIEVSNVVELIKSIGSNRQINIKPGTYNISEALFEKNNYLEWVKDFDGYEPIFSDIQNLEIIGNEKEETTILISPRYAFVLTFMRSYNIIIKNLTLGHTTGGYCQGGVLNFNDSSNIQIESCTLFGCGTVGLDLLNVENLKFQNSTIKECTYYLLKIDKSKKLEFINSKFHDTGEFDLMIIQDSQNIDFIHCLITNNWTSSTTFNHLFMLNPTTEKLKLSEVTITNNKVELFANLDNIIELENCTFENNRFPTPNKSK